MMADKDFREVPLEQSIRAAEVLLERQDARDSLIPFIQYTFPQFVPAPHHVAIAEKLEAVERGEKRRLMIFMPPRHGKQIANRTPIMTPNGWTTHGRLMPGDEVFAPDGTIATIVAVSEETSSQVRVSFTNGEEIYCHENHEWSVYSRADEITKTVETNYFFDKKIWSGGRATYQLPLVEPSEMRECVLPCEPYVFGAWLGDGSSDKPAITHDKADSGIIEYFEELGYHISAEWVHKDTGCITTNFGGPSPGRAGRLTKELQETKAWKNKHIPEPYKFSSIDQRKKLIAGLIDTDGCVDKKFGRVRIVTGSKRLAEDIVDVLKSLAQRPGVAVTQPCTSSSGIVGREVVFTIGFQPTIVFPTVLERKKIKRLVRQRRIGIQKVEIVGGDRRGRCISLDREDGMYLIGDSMIPTHNTETASIRFPAWYMGKNPDRKVILCSYNEEKASEYGAQVQGVVNSEEYNFVFDGVHISPLRRKKTAWAVEGRRGECVAVGPESSLTGRGGNLIIIDDPYKDRQDANSVNSRRKLMRWFDSVAYTRLEDNDAIILILTRWHHDDIAAELQRRAKDNPDLPDWDVLSLPAEAKTDDPIGRKPGEALWPERFPSNRLQEIKANNPREYASLYQQEPTPEEGDYFRRADFEFYEVTPKRSTMRIYGTSDYGASEDAKTSDYTVHCVWGMDSENKVYLLEMYREAGKLPKEWIGELVSMIGRWKPDVWFEERGQIINSVGPFLVSILRQKQIYVRRIQLTSSSDKVARSRAYQGMVSMRMIHLPRHRSWVEDFIAEHTQFPYSSHDDMVDNGSLLGRGLEDLRPGKEAIQTQAILQPRNWTIQELINRSGRRAKGGKVRNEAPIMGKHVNPFLNNNVAVLEQGFDLDLVVNESNLSNIDDIIVGAN